MKIFRIILIVLFSIISAYSGYATIGYILWGGEMPTIYGTDGTTTFMGMYLMAITFGVIFIISTALLILVCVRLHKTRKNNR